MDPFNIDNKIKSTSPGGDGGDNFGNAGAIDDFSFDRIDSLNRDDDFLSLGGIDTEQRSIGGEGDGGFNLENEKLSVLSPSISQFDALNLQATSTSTGNGEREVEMDDEDPFAALEAAIEEDKPKTDPSPEWKRMLDAIQTEENEQQPGAPTMIPENTQPPPSSSSTATATAPATTAPSSDMINSSLEDDVNLDAPILLHPLEEGNNNENTTTTNIEAEYSPSQVVAAGGHQGSETTEMTSSEGGIDGVNGGLPSGEDLAGTLTIARDRLLSEEGEDDPAQEIEDIRRRSFLILHPICSTLLAEKNNPRELNYKFKALWGVLLSLQPAEVQSCVDYVIFPLQIALDSITATRGSNGGGDGGASVMIEPSSSSSSSPSSTTAALPALKSDKTAESALAALLVLLERGTRCTSGDQLLSLLHRLCGILALPREAVSEEIRLGTLKIVTNALLNVPYDMALQSAVQEESSAALIGHLGSLLVKTAAAEVDAGSSGNKKIRIEALRALKTTIQAVDNAEALSFFLPGLVTGLARALLVAFSGHNSRGFGSQGRVASGVAAVEALEGLTSLLKATLGNESVAEILNLSLEDRDDGQEGGAFFSTATERAGAAATPAATSSLGISSLDVPGSSSSWENLTGDAALVELFKLSKKNIEPLPLATKEKEKFDFDDDDDEMKIIKSSASPSKLPVSQPPQPGEAPKLRVERTEEWIRTSSVRIEDMLMTVLPPLATDSSADVREALVHACADLSTNCSMALSGCIPTFTDIILALAQDTWPAVAAAARSTLKTTTAPSAQGLPAPPSSSLPILARAESCLKAWIYDLPAALRRGDEAGKAHALKITTCLEACPPHLIVNQLLSHSNEANQLVSVLAECFAVDADSVGLLLVAAPEAAGAAFTTTTAVVNSGGDTNINQETPSSSTSSTPFSTGSVSLPRMPLGLQFISTQKSYECLANLIRTLAAVAVAADNNIFSGTNAVGSTSTGSAGSISGTASRSLIDGCLQHIQRLLDTSLDTSSTRRAGAGVKKSKKKESSSSPMEIDGSTDVVGDTISWTISAAQMVFVLTELLFGASTAWQPKYPSPLASSSSPSSSSFPSSSKELEALIALVLPELVETRIWNLPTTIGAPSSSSASSFPSDIESSNNNISALPSSSPGFTLKDRGSNALLQRAILDCIGTSARALGSLFTTNGRLVRSILLPVVQKMGDPCRIVASSADTTIQAICTFCGYCEKHRGLRQLVADNADYIVDGLCRQLRQPENFPMAPQLFAALLRQGGVAPGLVPLLAEPARQALLGISIVARRKRPEDVLSFVLCLREIASGAGLVAQETCAELENFVAVVEERRELLLEKIQEQEMKGKKEKEEVKIGVVEDISEIGDESEVKNSEKMAEIDKYFDDYRARKQRKGTPFPENDETDDTEMDNDDIKVPVLLDEWNQIQISRKKAASCATLAQSASDTAGPLILSSALPVAIQSIKTCSEALEALKYASRGVEICAQQIDPVILPPGGVLGPTPDPSTAAFLPSVHLLWSPLMGALRDWRVAVVENVLSMLSHISQLAGSFLARRFAEEAWPVMQRLLLEGPSQKLIIAPGQDDLSSPAVVQRAQRAVLECIRTMATGGEGTEAIISSIAAPALVATAELMGEKHPAVIREHATNAFVALSSVDPDAAWGLLVAAIRGSHSVAATAEKITVSSSSSSSPSSSFSCPAGLPAMSEICPAPPNSTTGEKYVPKGLKTCGELKLQALLKQVNTGPVSWHNEVDKLLSFSIQSEF